MGTQQRMAAASGVADAAGLLQQAAGSCLPGGVPARDVAFADVPDGFKHFAGVRAVRADVVEYPEGLEVKGLVAEKAPVTSERAFNGRELCKLSVCRAQRCEPMLILMATL